METFPKEDKAKGRQVSLPTREGHPGDVLGPRAVPRHLSRLLLERAGGRDVSLGPLACPYLPSRARITSTANWFCLWFVSSMRSDQIHAGKWQVEGDPG